AQVILDAITTDDPKLRYLVGSDAESLMSARQKISDEEWVAMGREMTLEEFSAVQSKMGVDLS
ncbi:MAG: hypothetical protein VYD09_01925, partial [Chloroflexota bacterium]|nr:hypothetical protein [Chloroflexota bacterium]